jgi:outer membrane lipoprotein SlyB
MKTFHSTTLMAALAVAASGSVYAQATVYGPEDEGRRFSDGSRVVCSDVEVRRADSDPNRIGGTAAGAVIGGLVGRQVGGGSGRDIATVGGAVAGGVIGRNVQGNQQEARGDRIVERRCERVWR